MKALENDRWPVMPLKDVIVDIQSGFAQYPNIENTGIPQIRTNNVSSYGDIDLSELTRVHIISREFEKYAVHKGDIIFNNTNSIEWVGKTAYFDLEGKFVLSNHMTRIRTDEDILNPEYLARYLYYLWQIRFAASRAKQWVNQAAIDQTDLIKFEIPLPPLPEQRRIVAILRQADQLRRLRREAEEKIKLLSVSLFYNLFGSGSANAEHSQTVRLRDLLANPLTGGFSPSETNDNPSGIPVFTLNALTDSGLDEHQIKYYPVEAYSGKGSDLKENDILISRSNTQELVGKVGRYRGRPAPVIYPDLMIRIRLKNPSDSPYVEGVLRSQAVTEIIKQRARGTSGSMKKISQGDINEFDILWPPEEFRQAYIQQLEQLDQQRERLRAFTHRLESLFQSLLSRAFTGELTAGWREQHRDEVERALSERPQHISREVTQKPVESDAWQVLHEQRPALLASLSQEQQSLLRVVLQIKGYFTQETVKASSQFSYHVIRQGLQLFAHLGLILAVRLPDRPTQGVVVYVPAYRALADTDHVRELDLVSLQREIQSREQGFDYTEEEEVVS